jgi:outer membrane protein OmpA-like peptidoglycan-associated protein
MALRYLRASYPAGNKTQMVNIQFQQDSYKRGVVLGLTMAEIVLLILFSLLVVLAALVADKEHEIAKLSVERSELKARAVLSEEFVSELRDKHLPDPDAFFRELVLAEEKAELLQHQLQEASKRNERLQEELESSRGKADGHKWPPIISLSEADGFFFQTGSAELSEKFKVALVEKVVPRILQIASQYPDVDVIEVIGHTDEQIIKRRYSNLDSVLLDVLRNGDVASLVPADNAGLGTARAVAVVTRLLQDNRLDRFSRILPMSGAQLIQVDETLTRGAEGDIKERRRIEIRLRKYEKTRPDDESRNPQAR